MITASPLDLYILGSGLTYTILCICLIIGILFTPEKITIRLFIGIIIFTFLSWLGFLLILSFFYLGLKGKL